MNPIDGKLTQIIKESKETIWNNQEDYKYYYGEVGVPVPPIEHLEDIKKSKGELIIYSKNNEIYGWIGLKPELNKNEVELAGIGVHANFRNKGISIILMDKAINVIENWKMNRMVFQTSALFTSNSALYLRHYNARYKWNNTNYVDRENNIPWPIMDCEIEIPYKKRIDNEYKLSTIKSILNWEKNKSDIDLSPINNKEIKIGISLPYYDMKKIYLELENKAFDKLRNLYNSFEEATNNGYEIDNFININNDLFMYILVRAT